MECKICYEKFDKQTRKPFTINCGHTYCSFCLTSLKNRNDYECPTCGEPISTCQPNYTVLEILDMNLITDMNSAIRQEVIRLNSFAVKYIITYE
jgi:hypothetical protein